MALGIDYAPSANGGDFLGFIKFNAKAGRITRRDRENGENSDVDITRNFKCVMDIENIEIGWIDFDTGGAPSMVMSHCSKPVPPQPSPKHRKGVRVVLKLSKESGGDIRELSSHAKSFMRGMDKLHDDYLSGVLDNPGKLPVVVMSDTIAVVTGEGAKRSSNYAPVFEIVQWVKRPDDLVYKARVTSVAAPSAEAEAPRSPPTTGASRAAPPVAKAPPADDEDFG
jgi:hypothetical protein